MLRKYQIVKYELQTPQIFYLQFVYWLHSFECLLTYDRVARLVNIQYKRYVSSELFVYLFIVMLFIRRLRYLGATTIYIYMRESVIRLSVISTQWCMNSNKITRYLDSYFSVIVLNFFHFSLFLTVDFKPLFFSKFLQTFF